MWKRISSIFYFSYIIFWYRSSRRCPVKLVQMNIFDFQRLSFIVRSLRKVTTSIDSEPMNKAASVFKISVADIRCKILDAMSCSDYPARTKISLRLFWLYEKFFLKKIGTICDVYTSEGGFSGEVIYCGPISPPSINFCTLTIFSSDTSSAHIAEASRQIKNLFTNYLDSKF